MAEKTLPHGAGRMVTALGKLLLLAVAFPCTAAFLSGYSLTPALALIAATLVIEYGAAPVGLGLGLSPLFVLFTLCSVALGVTVFIFDIIGILGEQSERIRGFLQRSADRGRRYKILTTYGIYGLVPCVITLGFYVCPPVAGVFGWKRNLSILMIMAGYTGIAIVTILLTEGIFDVFFR